MEARSGQNCSNKIAPQVSFFSHCFTFYELAVYFHRRYKFLFWGGCLFFFSSLNYFNLVWLNFLWVLRMNFFTRTANYFWLVLRIIFYLWYWELYFHWRWQLFFKVSWIYYLAYNTLRACVLRGTGSSTFPLDFFAPSLWFHLLIVLKIFGDG
jgi:hypothetical protein